MKKLLFPILIIIIILIGVFLTNKPKPDKIDQLNTLIVLGMDNDGQLGKGLERIINPSTSSAGLDHSMALDAEGNVWTWGSNEHSQLGRTTENDSDQNVEVVNVGVPIKAIASTHEHVLLLDVDGHVWTFGSNFTGQLGDGKNKDNKTPYKIPNLENITKVVAGNKFSLAISKSGDVYGWGASCDDENKKIALSLLNRTADPDEEINEKGEGNYYNSKSTGEGSYEHGEDCLNEDAVGILSKVPRKLDGLKDIIDASAGYGHAILLDEHGSVWTFGCNLYGQLGRGNFDNSVKNSTPGKIDSLPKIKSVSAGFRHSIALDEKGQVYTWGINTKIDKDGNTFNSAIPTKLMSLKNTSQIAGGRDYSLAIDDKGKLYGWGNDVLGLIAGEKDHFIFKPVLVERLVFDKVISASAGHAHMIVIGE